VGRKLVSAPVVVAVVAVATVLLSSAPAFANAADPNAGTTATMTTNPDGSTTVRVSGTWSWPSQTGCSNRFGAGWAIAWNDPNQPGNVVSGHGITIYVGTPSDNTVHFNTPPCGTLDPNNHPHGSWGPATHTYAAGTAVGKVCVNMYDLHDTQANKPGDYIAGGSGHNGDNSVQTNAYDPNNPAFCVQPVEDSTQVPVGTIGGIGLAVALGGGLVFTTTRRRRSPPGQPGSERCRRARADTTRSARQRAPAALPARRPDSSRSSRRRFRSAA